MAAADIRQLLEPRIARGPLRLVTLVVQRGKVHALPRISEEYTRLLNEHRGVVMATVTSAVPLPADETAAIRSRVEAMAGAAGVTVQTEMLGGEPGATILRAARDWPADLVILGRSARASRGETYVGAQTRHVLEFAEQPVLVVPPRGH